MQAGLAMARVVRRSFAALGLAALLALAGGPAAAAEDAAGGERLQALIAILEDEAARGALVEELRALAAATRQEDARPGGGEDASGLEAGLRAGLDGLGRRVRVVADQFGAGGRIADWLAAQAGGDGDVLFQAHMEGAFRPAAPPRQRQRPHRQIVLRPRAGQGRGEGAFDLQAVAVGGGKPQPVGQRHRQRQAVERVIAIPASAGDAQIKIDLGGRGEGPRQPLSRHRRPGPSAAWPGRRPPVRHRPRPGAERGATGNAPPGICRPSNRRRPDGR